MAKENGKILEETIINISNNCNFMPARGWLKVRELDNRELKQGRLFFAGAEQLGYMLIAQVMEIGPPILTNEGNYITSNYKKGYYISYPKNDLSIVERMLEKNEVYYLIKERDVRGYWKPDTKNTTFKSLKRTEEQDEEVEENILKAQESLREQNDWNKNKINVPNQI